MSLQSLPCDEASLFGSYGDLEATSCNSSTTPWIPRFCAYLSLRSLAWLCGDQTLVAPGCVSVVPAWLLLSTFGPTSAALARDADNEALGRTISCCAPRA